MPSRMFWFLCPLLLLVPTAQLSGQQADKDSLRFAGVFANNMVLQQQADAPIWGFAKPGQLVTVQTSWSKKVSKAKADADGKWKTTIKTPAAVARDTASGGKYAVEIRTNDQSQRINNVLIGEVWICSGQSNMQWKMRGFGKKHFAEDVAKAKDPQIRLCQVPQDIALQPQDDVKPQWVPCTSRSVLAFSAVAYFFGHRLRQELDVPIGLISTNWGGSSCEAWMSQQELVRKFPEFNGTLDSYGQAIKKHGVVLARGKSKPKGFNQQMPSVLYNKMIHPLIPLSVRGVVWYQGEANIKRPLQYRQLFPELIKGWRQEWGQGDFPFYFVQIAPFHYQTNELPAALLREAQFQTLEIPNTGMVVTMDIGDPESIHPKQKKPVGERLALLALNRTYGRTDLVDSGPLYNGYEVESKKIRLKFKHTGSGLATRDGKAISHFTVAGKDRVFHPAVAEIKNDTVLVGSPEVARPVAVRYGWGNADEPNLMNKEGLPASSFRTDDWEILPSKPARNPRRRRGKK